MAASRTFSTLVEKNAETFRAMVDARWFNELELEYLELAGLDLDKKGNNHERYEILKPHNVIREPRETRKPRRSVIMLSQHAKTKQDRLRP